MQAEYHRLYQRKIRLFNELYRFTFNQCGFCTQSGCACTDRICSHVESQAKKRGVVLEHTGHKLRFIGPKGCVVPPHLRETCTIYLCGKAQEKPDFDRERYRRLKSICERIEWRLLELEEQYGGTLLKSR